MGQGPGRKGPPEMEEAPGQGRPSNQIYHRNTANNIRSKPRNQVIAEHVYRLGARALHELLIELATALGPEVIEIAEGYTRIDPGLLRALGGHRFPDRFASIEGGRNVA